MKLSAVLLALLACAQCAFAGRLFSSREEFQAEQSARSLKQVAPQTFGGESLHPAAHRSASFASTSAIRIAAGPFELGAPLAPGSGQQLRWLLPRAAGYGAYGSSFGYGAYGTRRLSSFGEQPDAEPLGHAIVDIPAAGALLHPTATGGKADF